MIGENSSKGSLMTGEIATLQDNREKAKQSIVDYLSSDQHAESPYLDELLNSVEIDCGKSSTRDAFWYLMDEGRIQLIPKGPFRLVAKLADER